MLTYDDITQQVVTECSGHLQEVGAKAYEDGAVIDIDESGRLACLSIYLGMVRFLQLNPGVWGDNVPASVGRISAKGKEVIGRRVSTEIGQSINMR